MFTYYKKKKKKKRKGEVFFFFFWGGGIFIFCSFFRCVKREKNRGKKSTKKIEKIFYPKWNWKPPGIPPPGKPPPPPPPPKWN